MIKKYMMAAFAGMVVAGSAMAMDLSEKNWDEIVEQAKKEGEVSWFVWYLQPQFRESVKSFEDEYGIKVTIPEGSLESNVNKAMAERKRKKGDIDVLALGPDKYEAVLKANLLEDLTFLSNYADSSHVLQGVDGEGKAIGYWGNQVGLAYDPDRIDVADLPQSFEELGAWIKAHPKQFAYNDMNGGGAGSALVRSVISNLDKDNVDQLTNQFDANLANWSKAWEWFANYKDDMILTASNADSLTRLNDGEFILTPAWEDHMASLQAQGAIDKRFKIYIPQFGMAGGGNFSSVMKNAKHPAAALVFMNWLTSPETQTALNAKFGSAPQNKNADDSKSLIPVDQRANSRFGFPAPYEAEMKKQFIKNVLLGK